MPEDNCLCRKPNPGLLLQAMKDFDIDLKQSWMIGNSISDMNTAKAAGCNWLLLKNDQTLLQVVRELVK